LEIGTTLEVVTKKKLELSNAIIWFKGGSWNIVGNWNEVGSLNEVRS